MADNLTYGTGLGLGDAIRQRKKMIGEMTGTPYEPDVLEQWHEGKVLTPEQMMQMANDVAEVKKIGQRTMAGIKTYVPKLAKAVAPTIGGMVGGVAPLAGKLVPRAMAAGRVAQKAIQGKKPTDLAQALYRRAQRTGGQVAQNLMPATVGGIKRVAGLIRGKKPTMATAE
jgi:hypothetical protein